MERSHADLQMASAPATLATAEHAPRPDGAVPAFDTQHPPDPALIEDCVHCGFCLPTCPTYLLWGEEMDSPRGRIWLMKLATEGEIGLTGTATRHFDQCLGCMACVTACPSGVRYDRLIEATRGQVERRAPRSTGDRLYRRLLYALFPHPERLRRMAPLLWLYQRSGLQRLVRAPGLQRLVPARLRAMEAMLPPVTLAEVRSQLPAYSAARTPERRRRVGLLAGCVQQVFFSPVNAAIVRVLTAEGCDVVVPPAQGCCGALSFHGGREAEAQAYARRLIDSFEAADVDTIAINAAGCGSTIKEYGYLLRDDPAYAERAHAFAAKVRDVTELLAELEPVATRHPLPLRVAYHDACHLSHAQGVRAQPRAILRGIPQLELLEIPESEICCGSAGTYNLTEPEPARQLGERKARNVLSTRPDVLAAANPGCLLQISAALERQGARVPTMHPVELVDASIRGVYPPGLAATAGAGVARTA
jgi:glycolate oxidase iron-sulfur subunit